MAEISEDLLMFDVAVDAHDPPLLRLVRRIGLADEQHDYVGAEVFECWLVYATRPGVDDLDEDGLDVSFDPGRTVEDVERFVAAVQGTDAYRVLIADRRPARIEWSR